MRYWHVLTRLRGTVCSSMLKQKSTSYSCSFSWFQGCDCGRAGCRTTDPHKDCFSTESTWFVFNHNPLLLDAVLEFKVYISRVFRYFSVRTISSWCFLTSTESTVLNRSQFQTFIPLRLRRLGIAHCSLPQQARATRGDRQAISQNISTSAATASTYCGTAGSKAWPGKRTCHSLHEELNFSESKDSTMVFQLESGWSRYTVCCCMLGWNALTSPGCASQACTARLAQAGVWRTDQCVQRIPRLQLRQTLRHKGVMRTVHAGRTNTPTHYWNHTNIRLDMCC